MGAICIFHPYLLLGRNGGKILNIAFISHLREEIGVKYAHCPHLFPAGRDRDEQFQTLTLNTTLTLECPHLFPPGRDGGEIMHIAPISSLREEMGVDNSRP